jgi:hypothetical protein
MAFERNQTPEQIQYQALYIYGIVNGRFSRRFPDIGIGNRKDEVFPIHFKDVTALVSHTPFIEYDPTEEYTLAHENVIQEVLKCDCTLAPMRFCTVLKSRNDVMKLMHSGYMAFKRNLLKVRNKHEFDVKVFLHIAQTKETGDALLEESRTIATACYNTLKALTDDTMLSEQVTGEMILNASFLVHKEKRETFYNAVLDFDKEYTEKIKIRISGPTAPYNFVSMPTK